MTLAIGISEVALGIWILLGYFKKWKAIFQMILIASMNILEFTIAPEFLLWGRWNIVFADIFIFIIYWFQYYPLTKNNSVKAAND